jgi:hypothetical protein
MVLRSVQPYTQTIPLVKWPGLSVFRPVSRGLESGSVLILKKARWNRAMQAKGPPGYDNPTTPFAMFFGQQRTKESILAGTTTENSPIASLGGTDL